MNRQWSFTPEKKNEIQRFARRMRLDMLEMMKHAGANGAHIGGAFSAAEILASLYCGWLDISLENPLNPNRDRFILSKGHTALALYSALYEAGFLTQEEMMSFEDNGGHFSTHCCKNQAKGIELSSGSLGLGLGYGAGCALTAKLEHLDYDCVVLLGDGECNEGSVWEAVQFAAKYKLDNLIAVVDFNHQSLDGFTTDTMPIANFPKVFEGFGWDVININGNDVSEIGRAFSEIQRNGKPTAIIAETLKGKGVSFMENTVGWHHTVLSQQQYDEAKAELESANGL